MAMPRFTNWRKSTRSNGNQACVAIAHSDTAIGIRDTKNTSGPVLILTPTAWHALRADITR